MNNKENINPAINEPGPTEMSAEEFKRNLITWFEDRGLLSDLRAHLRKQMIGIIKDTTLGQTMKVETKISPKSHVINILIAEFLLKNKYHYSLSVFSTEVPFFVLPEFSLKSFSPQNFYDIMEALGISAESVESRRLHETYFQENEQSLLGCILRLMSKISKNKILDDGQGTSDDFGKMEAWIKEVHMTLKRYGVSESMIVPIREQLRMIFENEMIRVKTEEVKKYHVKQSVIDKSLENRESDIKKLISQMENAYLQEKKKISEEWAKEHENVEKLKRNLRQRKIEFETKNNLIVKKEEVIKQHEKEVEDQLEILKSRMRVMQNVYDSIIEENRKISEVKDIRKSPNSEDVYDRLHNEYTILRDEIQSTKTIIERFQKIVPCADKYQQTIESSEDSEMQLLKGMLERVQKENGALRFLNLEQQRRIDELTIRNSMLINELDLNSRRGVITVPPLLPSQSMPIRASYSRPTTLNGGGENQTFASNAISPVFRYGTHFRDYFHRKNSKRFSSSSGSSTPTDEVLKDAKLRLQRLEEETEEVDRHYRAFRQRQSREHNQISLNNIPDPLLRVQESTTRDSFPAFAIFNNRHTNGFTMIPSTEQPSTSFNVRPMNELPELQLQSTGPLGASSRMSRLRDISISSIEISSDNDSENDE